jgi:hypothetical protein
MALDGHRPLVGRGDGDSDVQNARARHGGALDRDEQEPREDERASHRSIVAARCRAVNLTRETRYYRAATR